MTPIATSPGMAQSEFGGGRRVPTFSHWPSSSCAETTRLGGRRGWRQRRSRGHWRSSSRTCSRASRRCWCGRRHRPPAGSAPGPARRARHQSPQPPSSSRQSTSTSSTPTPARWPARTCCRRLSRFSASAGSTALASASQKRSSGVLAVRRICSCRAAGVSSSSRMIEAVRERICSRFADCTASRRSSRKIQRLIAWARISASSSSAISWPASRVGHRRRSRARRSARHRRSTSAASM